MSLKWCGLWISQPRAKSASFGVSYLKKVSRLFLTNSLKMMFIKHEICALCSIALGQQYRIYSTLLSGGIWFIHDPKATSKKNFLFLAPAHHSHSLIYCTMQLSLKLLPNEGRAVTQVLSLPCLRTFTLDCLHTDPPPPPDFFWSFLLVLKDTHHCLYMILAPSLPSSMGG